MTRIFLNPGRLILLALGLVIALYLVMALPSEQNDRPVFRMTLSNEPPTLDWNLATDSVSFTVLTNLMEGLTEYDHELRPHPAVARSWEVSPDGRTYLFHLRDDVYWSDGQKLRAADFEYSWKRLLNPLTAAQYAYFLYDIEGAQEYNTGKIRDDALVGVWAVDDLTLKVRLRKPVVFFPSITTFMVTFPMRKDIVEQYGNRWTDPEHIVTNGPFLLDEWHHEYKLTLRANPHYFGDQPRIEKVTMYIINQATTALTLYETGDLELASLPPEAMEAYKGSEEYRTTALLRGYYYGFNVLEPPFDDPRVRRAFSMAIDRREFPAILKRGEIPSSYWIPPGMPYHNPGIGLAFDPERARALLSEAGYPGGRGFPSVTATYNTSPENRLIAENLQAQWKRNLGLSVQLDNLEWKVYLHQLETSPPPLFRLGWGADYPDPDNFMNLFTSTSGNNRTRWRNSVFDELIGSAVADPNTLGRQSAYDKAQKILLEEDVVIMPLFVATQNWVVKPTIGGLRLNAMELLYLKELYFITP